jgi:hypothetical protein
MPTKKKTTAKTTKSAKTTLVSNTPITASALATMLGVKLTAPLSTVQTRRLLKALPGYVGLLDDAAAQLDADASLLNLKGVTGAALLALKTQQKFLAARESVSELVYRSIYEQRLGTDSDAMTALYAINKRVLAMKSEDPDLAARWAFLADFLRNFHPGTNAAKAATAANRADAKSVKTALKAKKTKATSATPAN